MAVGLSNAAVINWTKSMSLQYAADGILVTTVAQVRLKHQGKFTIDGGKRK
jgi:NAD(P)-dependent dehydrogenase (short-subunit alcohol dehydrogenase family)